MARNHVKRFKRIPRIKYHVSTRVYPERVWTKTERTKNDFQRAGQLL